MALTAEQLLSGGGTTHDVAVPPALVAAGGAAGARVVLRPLTVRDLQRIDPPLKFEEVSQLPAGLARYLVDEINTLSGIDTPRNALEELVQAPLAKACFVLAKEFGWTPEQVSAMTIGQILLYLEMSRSHGGKA